MNYGPLEFAAHLKRKGALREESATVKAAREAAPSNRLTIISGGPLRPRVPDATQVEAVCVFEAVAAHAPREPQSCEPVHVRVGSTTQPLVLVLSSHHTVQWRIALAPDANLNAVLLSGYGESTVVGAGDAPVASIGGFYAFKLGSVGFRHLESEVLRCTGRHIGGFQSECTGSTFDIGDA